MLGQEISGSQRVSERSPNLALNGIVLPAIQEAVCLRKILHHAIPVTGSALPVEGQICIEVVIIRRAAMPVGGVGGNRESMAGKIDPDVAIA